MKTLRDWRAEQTAPDGLGFPIRTGRPLSRDAVEHRIARHTSAAAARCPSLTSKKVTVHVLRHTCAMRLLHAGVLLEIYGAGRINAAIILSVWSHAGRIHHEGALARLAGVSPIEIASGGSTEHRPNRGGDRQLNLALHSIAKTRMERDPHTQPYVERRTRERTQQATHPT